MTPTDVLDDIISQLEPENVPSEYIIMAKVTDYAGAERIIRGPELDRIMQNPDSHQIVEVRVILNVKKLRRAIIDEVNDIYEEVNRRFNGEPE